MKKTNSIIKSISMPAGSEKTKVFINSVNFFSTHSGVSESKYIADSVIKYLFPEDFLCRDVFTHCLADPSDESFSNIFCSFFERLSEFSVPVRNQARLVLREILHIFGANINSNFNFTNHCNYIDNIDYYLRYLIHKIDIYKTTSNDFGLIDCDDISQKLNFLQQQWSNNPSHLVMCDIFRVIENNWDYFQNDDSSCRIVYIGCNIFLPEFSVDHFCDCYDIFRKLSKLNCKEV